MPVASGARKREHRMWRGPREVRAAVCEEREEGEVGVWRSRTRVCDPRTHTRTHTHTHTHTHTCRDRREQYACVDGHDEILYARLKLTCFLREVRKGRHA
jgi:hypothetical protein